MPVTVSMIVTETLTAPELQLMFQLRPTLREGVAGIVATDLRSAE
ncbi:MAG: hypothetical protein PVH80_00175 [Anaerolineae bacterium]